MPKFMTGAHPSPRHKLAAAEPHRARATPDSFLAIPPQLSYWLNDQDGDCVTAEEAFAKACYSYAVTGTELFVPDNVVGQWARQHGVLNGANLTDVMEWMAKSGFTVNGATYDDGPYQSVDWTTDTILRSAIYQGPVKIGVAAGQLQNIQGIGQQNGWFGLGLGEDQNEDHCTSLCGFGTLAQLVVLFNKIQPSLNLVLPSSLPAGLTSTSLGYGYFTWNSVGIMDRQSMMNTTGEAWLRLPTTPGTTPTPTPIPIPTPTPTPVPTVLGAGTYTLSGGGTLTIGAGR